MANYEFITLRYGNSCDIGDVVFQNGFTYELNVIGVLGEPKYEHIERVNENEDKEISFNAKTLKKTITLLTVGNEQRLDVLNFIRLCDTKILINKAGQVYNINEMQVEADLSSGIALIKVQFVLFTVTNTICCSNNIINDGTNPPTDITDVIKDDDERYINPSAIALNSIYLLDIDGDFFIVKRVDTINNSGLVEGWNYLEINDFSVFKAVVSGTTFYFQKDLFGKVNAKVLFLPYLATATLVSETTYRIEGQCLQGYILGFQAKPLSGSYANASINGTAVNYTTALNFNGSGVTVEKVGTRTYIRAYLATINDPSTPICYSNEVIL